MNLEPTPVATADAADAVAADAAAPPAPPSTARRSSSSTKITISEPSKTREGTTFVTESRILVLHDSIDTANDDPLIELEEIQQEDQTLHLVSVQNETSSSLSKLGTNTSTSTSTSTAISSDRVSPTSIFSFPDKSETGVEQFLHHPLSSLEYSTDTEPINSILASTDSFTRDDDVEKDTVLGSGDDEEDLMMRQSQLRWSRHNSNPRVDGVVMHPSCNAPFNYVRTDESERRVAFKETMQVRYFSRSPEELETLREHRELRNRRRLRRTTWHGNGGHNINSSDGNNVVCGRNSFAQETLRDVVDDISSLIQQVVDKKNKQPSLSASNDTGGEPWYLAALQCAKLHRKEGSCWT